jgi:hypothetical protein
MFFFFAIKKSSDWDTFYVYIELTLNSSVLYCCCIIFGRVENFIFFMCETNLHNISTHQKMLFTQKILKISHFTVGDELILHEKNSLFFNLKMNKVFLCSLLPFFYILFEGAMNSQFSHTFLKLFLWDFSRLLHIRVNS